MRIGLISNCLRLHRRIDDELGKIGRLRRAGTGRHSKIFCSSATSVPRSSAAASLSSTTCRRASYEGNIPHRSRAGNRGSRPSHFISPRRRGYPSASRSRALDELRGVRRVAWPLVVDGAETFLEKAPIDRARKLRQRGVHTDDLVEPRLKKIGLTALASLVKFFCLSPRPRPKLEA